MYPKLHSVVRFFFASILGFACVTVYAQATPTAAAGQSSLRGQVTDPTGALIPGTQITVATAKGAVVAHLVADAVGGYVARGLAAGSYVIQAIAPGFNRYVSAPIQVAAGQTMIVDIKMAIATAQQQVHVTAEGAPTISTQADQNSNTVVLQGKQLNALSDDPDELQNELQALAGPSAGPNGGQIYINGFTGGQLPPKSAIREIRVNQNPFSAEFDRLGYGRIEILTKPGTGAIHARFFVQGNDDSLNTGNPFVPTSQLPSYYSVMYNGTVSGPITKNSSFFITAMRRQMQNDSVYFLKSGGPVFDVATNTYSFVQPLSGALFNPNTFTVFSPRIDLQLGQNNTLTVLYQLFRYNVSGSIGSTSLPSTSATSDMTNNSIQFDDTQVISSRLVNETRGEFRRRASTSAPVSTAPSISVPGAFSGGGNFAQSMNSHADHWELQNFTTLTAGNHAIKFGMWLRDNREAISTNGNFNGSFTFPSVAAFVATANGVAQGKTFAQISASCTEKAGCLPTNLTYTTGAQKFQGNVFDGSLFFQDDWKVKPNLTLSGGLRWETQNHTADHSDWGPRLAVAYAPHRGAKNNGPDKTVIRAGFGFFYDRFEVGDLMNLEQYNRTQNSQRQVSITNPACFNANSLSNINLATCGTGTTATPKIYQISPSYRAPYSEQASVSVARQLTKSATLTLTYLHSFGVHQLVVRNSNAFLPGTFQYGSSTLTGVRPTSFPGIVQQYFPEAVYKQNQIIVNTNAQLSRNFSVMGFYNWTQANSDGGDGSNPSNSYNLSQDYGRAAFVHQQMLFVMGTYAAPWALSFNPFLVVQSGNPYNFTTTNDLTGDAFFNDRPSFASAASNPADVVSTQFGTFNTVPQPGETLVGPNLGNSPSSIAFNLRLTRAFGVGPKVEGGAGAPPPGGFFGGPGGGPHHGGGPGGPFMMGGMRPGGENVPRKYSLSFSIQALNLFNNINLNTPVGTISTNPSQQESFGHSTNLAGRIFSTSSASRRVFVQTIFQF